MVIICKLQLTSLRFHLLPITPARCRTTVFLTVCHSASIAFADKQYMTAAALVPQMNSGIVMCK